MQSEKELYEKIESEIGYFTPDEQVAVKKIIHSALIAHANEVIERCAIECERSAEKYDTEAKRYWPDSSSHDDYCKQAGQSRDLAASIRSLKTKEQA